MNDIDLAQSLFRKPAEIVTEAFGGRLPPYTVEAEAMEDSANGMVAVQFMGDTVNLTDGDPDGEGNTSDELSESGTAAQWVSVPCSATVKAGERVLVTIQDGSPIDCTSIGWGDTIATAVSNAVTLAEQAEQIASAIGQYAWNDSAGTHVSTEEGVSEGTRNILLNSYGILLRAAANYLAALTQSGIAFYDGNGNAASNIVASFGSNGAQVGSDSDTHLTVDADSVDVVDPVKGVLMSMGWDSTNLAAFIESLRPIYLRHPINGGNTAGGGSAYVGATDDDTDATGSATWANAAVNTSWATGLNYRAASAEASSDAGGAVAWLEAQAMTSSGMKRAELQAYADASKARIIMRPNNCQLCGIDKDGATEVALVHINGNGNIILGNSANSGRTRVYGKNVDIVVPSGGKFRMDLAAPVLVKQYTKVVAATTHGANTEDLTFDLTTSGYTPVAISGWRWDSGTRQNFFLNWSQYIDGNTAHMRFTNFHSTDSANGTLRIYVMFVRTEMV